MFKPFFVRQNRKLKKIYPQDVVCLRIDENYTNIFCNDGKKYIVRSTLSGVLKKLPPDLFIKIHRAYAVSINHIDDIAYDHLVMDGEPLPIGRQYRESLLGKLNIIE